MDDERLLAHGRHRVRHRQTAARPGGRKHPRRRDADVPQPLGEHPQRHAQEGPRQGRGTRPAQTADAPANGAAGPLRPLRKDLQALGEAGHQGAALLHHRLPEHRHLEARLRLHLRLSPQERGRHRPRSRTGASPLFRNFDETTGNPLAAPEHAAHRQRAARSRRCARRQLPQHGRRRDRALPP